MAIPNWLGRAAIGIAVLVMALFVVRGSCSGYDSRRHVNEAMGEAAPLKARIEEFHREHRRLPQTGEAAALRLQEASLSSARRIEWSGANRMLVITMGREPYANKRFGWAARERDGALEWTCRPIDIDAKHLPADCRP